LILEGDPASEILVGGPVTPAILQAIRHLVVVWVGKRNTGVTDKPSLIEFTLLVFDILLRFC
jgi:hypothetical protein